MGDDNQKTQLLQAYLDAFAELQLAIKQFRVGDYMLELIQDDVIDREFQFTLVGERNHTMKGQLFYNYLQREGNIDKYNNFIKVCEEKDAPLAKSIKEKLLIHRQLKGLPVESNPIQANDEGAATEKFLKMLLNAYESAFIDLQLFIEHFRVGDNLFKLLQKEVIDKNLQLKLVGTKDPTQKGPILYNYLLEKNNVATYRNFIHACEELDSNLAQRIKQKLQYHIKLVGLTADYYAQLQKSSINFDNRIQASLLNDPQTSQTEGKDIFLSYQWSIKEKVKCIYNKLTAKGYTCWMDNSALGGGDRWHAEIDKGIRNCKVYLSFVTVKYAESLNCYKETNLSVELKKPIIPLLMEENAWPPKNMGTLIGHLQYIPFKSTSASPEQLWSGENFNQLLERLKFYISRPAQSSSSPADAQENVDLNSSPSISEKN